MERMDTARRVGGAIWVVAGAAAMVTWALVGSTHQPGVVTWIVMAVIASGTLAQLGSARVAWWGARLGGATIGVELVGAVADRFGLLGAPGASGVSWGDWAHFRSEAAELVPWPHLVQPAAVAATVAELVLGVVLLAGVWWRLAGKATAGLFVVYLVAMVPSMGAASLLEYAVPVLVGGALVASARGERPSQGRADPAGEMTIEASDTVQA
jgi:hypothetical protein